MDSAPAGERSSAAKGDEMPEHKIGTRGEWQAARDQLARLATEQAERNEEIKSKRLDLPWGPGEKEDEVDSEQGRKTPRELFPRRAHAAATTTKLGAQPPPR